MDSRCDTKNLDFCLSVLLMSHHTSVVLRQKIPLISRSLFMAVVLLGVTQIASAGPTVDQLSDCLVKSTTATDKTAVLQWTLALSVHPDLKAYSNVTDEQRAQLDKKLAQNITTDIGRTVFCTSESCDSGRRFAGCWRRFSRVRKYYW